MEAVPRGKGLETLALTLDAQPRFRGIGVCAYGGFWIDHELTVRGRDVAKTQERLPVGRRNRRLTSKERA